MYLLAMIQKKNIIWIVADDRLGTTRQLEGVAHSLSGTIIHKPVTYDWRVKLPNFLRRILGNGVTAHSWSSLLKQDAPDVILSGGRRTAPITAYLKRLYPHAVTMHFMNPNYPSSAFDFVAIPRHDQSIPSGNNIVFFDTAPNQISDQRLADERKTWMSQFKKYPAPRIAVLIGGKTKTTTFDTDMARAFGHDLNALAKRLKGSLLITDSRRTGVEQTAEIKSMLTVPHYFYEYGVSEGTNPMFGFMACADVVVVTGESISMVSEALTTGKPVFVYDHPSLLAPKHKRFTERLKEIGAIQSLTSKSKLFTPKLVANSSTVLAEVITQKLKGKS